LVDPCAGNFACGKCSVCTVRNHAAHCSCAPGTIGNPLVACSLSAERCSSRGSCSPGSKCESGYCIKSCRSSGDCSCDQQCLSGFCRNQCSVDEGCPQVRFL